MTKIIIKKCVYKIHPIYDLYAGSKDGNIINIIKRIPHKGNEDGNCYMKCMVRKHGQPGFKTYHAHRFIFECFHGIIPDGKEIDHINNVKDDNRLCNLQLMTHQENCKKSAKDWDYKSIFKNRKCVRAINKNTNKVSFYNSLYAVQQHLKINASSVKRVCEETNYRKLAISEKDGDSYKFEYIKEEDLPNNYFKSLNIKPRRVSDEDKRKHRLEWWNKEFECPNCGKLMKNNTKYKHKKRCDK